MKKIAVVFILFFMIPQLSFAEELSQEKKAAIDELLEVTGAAKIGEMFGNAFIDQMTMVLK